MKTGSTKAVYVRDLNWWKKVQKEAKKKGVGVAELFRELWEEKQQQKKGK